MSCDKCRWFNKKGFASGFGDCVFYRFVCSSEHKVVCVHYEEYEQRPHGEWIFKHNSSDIWCSNCDENFDEIPQKFLFCPNCGADMRKER